MRRPDIDTNDLVRACKALRHYVRFRSAGFRLDRSGHGVTDRKDTNEIIRATHSYVESWVVPIIDAIESCDRETLREKVAFESRGEESGYSPQPMHVDDPRRFAFIPDGLLERWEV